MEEAGEELVRSGVEVPARTAASSRRNNQLWAYYTTPHKAPDTFDNRIARMEVTTNPVTSLSCLPTSYSTKLLHYISTRYIN